MRTLFLATLPAVLAFQAPRPSFVPSSVLHISTTPDADITDVAASLEMSTAIAKNELLDVCRDLKSM